MDPGPSLTEPFIGEIKLLTSGFAPRGWAYCDGQLLSIQSYSPLFSLIGTKFGGDGKEKFKLPKIPPMKIPKPEKETEEPAKEPEKQPEKEPDKSQQQPDAANPPPMPYVELYWMISLHGVFPSRN